MITQFLEKIFGANWRTSLWGTVSALVAFMAVYPDIFEPLPPYWETLCKQFVAFCISAGLFKLGVSSRDHVVSEKAANDLQNQIKELKHEKF